MTSPTLAERIVEAWEDIPDWANEDKAQIAIDNALEEAAKGHGEQAKRNEVDAGSASSPELFAQYQLMEITHRESAASIRAMKDKP